MNKAKCNYCGQGWVRHVTPNGMHVCSTCYFTEDFSEPYQPWIVGGVRLTRRGQYLLMTLGTILFVLALAVASS